MRLDKYLSYALNITRKTARGIITGNRIKINNNMVQKKDFYIDESTDIVFFDNKPVVYHAFIYLMVNKPKGYITATKDQRLPTVLDLIKQYEKYNLFMAGRLDKDTEGFVLLTNDGAFAYNITKPGNRLPKKYLLEITGNFFEQDVVLCRQGFVIQDGKGRFIKTKPAGLDIINANKAYLTISEGKYHQIKQMCRHMGKELIHLKRVAIGEVELDSLLQPGDYRMLREEEINKLKKQFT